VLTALPSYRDQGRPFLAFVYDIAAHKVADANRSSSHNRAEPALEAGGPEAQLKQIEVAERTAKLLDMLPDKQREVIRLRIVEGLSAEETAEIVGSTPGAVRVAQHRALSRLRIATAETAAERTAHAVGSTSETVQVAHHRALSRLCSVLESE
jgi:RNA polymerase sigma-70 factor (ECF subfamily)